MSRTQDRLRGAGHDPAAIVPLHGDHPIPVLAPVGLRSDAPPESVAVTVVPVTEPAPRSQPTPASAQSASGRISGSQKRVLWNDPPAPPPNPGAPSAAAVPVHSPLPPPSQTQFNKFTSAFRFSFGAKKSAAASSPWAGTQALSFRHKVAPIDPPSSARLPIEEPSLISYTQYSRYDRKNKTISLDHASMDRIVQSFDYIHRRHMCARAVIPQRHPTCGVPSGGPPPLRAWRPRLTRVLPCGLPPSLPPSSARRVSGSGWLRCA